jgi:ubiquitin-like protein Pup
MRYHAMAERTQKPRTTPERSTEVDTDVEVSTSATTGDKLIAELDDLLDEIDEVLESNAEDFVKSYVQKGGQ